MNPESLSKLLQHLEARYPHWAGFADPRFVKDELDYKRAVIARAQIVLGASALRGLLNTDSGAEDMLARFKQLGQATNLLYNATPSTGDLSILYQGTDKRLLCAALFDLLHGSGDSPARLGRFVEFADSVGATAKWAFITYFLFVVHPHQDMFIKPKLFSQFLELMGASDLWSNAPSQLGYAHIMQLCNELKMQLAPYGAHDMVDVQGFIWAAVSQSERKPKRKPEAPTPEVAPIGLRERAPPYITSPSYSLAQCAAETGLDEAALRDWLSAIQRKRQAIVYGPPGTGKTFAAQKLGLHIAGGNQSRIEIVQFHPAYSYEDFVQGLRPKARADGKLDYPIVDGRFVQFCKAAQNKPGEHVLIIDEINRANLARVFGELMFLLEYRDQAITLASGERFSIPSNVVLLGTMNTADRSIALVDHALRRRFAFLPLRPNYELLRRARAEANVNVDELIHTLQQINAHIGDANYHLGPSFFLGPDLGAQLPSIWQTEIEPYLEEYFFDKPDVVAQFRWEALRHKLLIV
jgi:hypothetical protein